MEGTNKSATLASVAATCALCAAAAWAPASTEGLLGSVGSAKPIPRTPLWQQVASIQPPSDADWTIGPAVALKGQTLAVGPGRDWDLGVDRGPVHIFQHAHDAWNETDVLSHPTDDPHAFFGASIALTDSFLAIGSPYDSSEGFQSGRVFVYRRLGERWLMDASLQRPESMAGDLAGEAVAIDGDTMVMGVPKADMNGADTGAAEVFQLRQGAWIHMNTLTPPTPQIGSLFGLAVSIHEDRMFIGAPGDHTLGPATGRVHVFRRTASGWTWDGSVLCPSGARAWFGASIAAAEGCVVVGAPRAARLPSSESFIRGAAWLIEHRDGAWTCGQMLVPSGASDADAMGCAVATDGRTIVCGASADSIRGDQVGCAITFTQGSGGWIPHRLDPPSGQPGSLIGHCVAVNGSWIAIGRLGNPENDPAPGEVSLFQCPQEPNEPPRITRRLDTSVQSRFAIEPSSHTR